MGKGRELRQAGDTAYQRYLGNECEAVQSDACVSSSYTWRFAHGFLIGPCTSMEQQSSCPQPRRMPLETDRGTHATNVANTVECGTDGSVITISLFTACSYEQTNSTLLSYRAPHGLRPASQVVQQKTAFPWPGMGYRGLDMYCRMFGMVVQYTAVQHQCPEQPKCGCRACVRQLP